MKTHSKLYHCTFYKCGSQWVRDVLSDPSLFEFTNCPLVLNGVDVPSSGWPTLTAAGLASPIYTAGFENWQSRSNPGSDVRCLVVSRDPRDVIVSLVLSLAFSHTPSEVTALLRLPIRNASRADRIRIGIHLFSHWAAQFRSWFGPKEDDDVLRIDYSELIADEQASFRRIFSYFGWEIPEELATQVISTHSFLSTSGGRRLGEENEFSHRRKGVTGDWLNHFNQETGAIFEAVFPDLLLHTGYEDHSEWWRELPQHPIAVGSVSTEVRLARLLEAFEAQQRELDIQREAAAERLRDVQLLNELYGGVRHGG
jgi:hypothetical protein